MTIMQFLYSFAVLLVTLSVALCFECGVRKKTHTTLMRGENALDSYRGQWPWYVPLFHQNKGFFCGATLISDRHLLTGE
jgi:secreted trypsin-like serine protease